MGPWPCTGLPQSSAHRNVTAVIDAGIVRKVATGGDHWRVELAEEPAGHHHLVGTCGRVKDVPPTPSLEQALDARSWPAGRTRRHRGRMVQRRAWIPVIS